MTAVFNSPFRFFICSKTRGRSASGTSPVMKSLRANLAARDRVERLADESRRVMERRLDRDLGIVQRRTDRSSLRCPSRSPPKRFTVPPLRTICEAHCHVIGWPDRLDHGVGAAPAFGQLAHTRHRIVDLGRRRTRRLRPSRSAACIWLVRLPTAITRTFRCERIANELQARSARSRSRRPCRPA